MQPTELVPTRNQESGHRFIDTHCHLDDGAFADDLDDVLDQSRAAGVTAWINVGYSPTRWRSTIQLASEHDGVALMLGLHPSEAELWAPELCRELLDLLKQTGARAVGETGIDLFRGETNLDRQKVVFEMQLAIAVELGLPAVIHMRAAESQVLDTLAGMSILPPLLFHSFDGGPALVEFILGTGSMIGIGGLVTRARQARLRDQLLRVPATQMVLETDSPYLMPSKLRGRRNSPGNVPLIASVLADLIETDVHYIAQITTQNAERFFGALEEAAGP